MDAEKEIKELELRVKYLEDQLSLNMSYSTQDLIRNAVVSSTDGTYIYFVYKDKTYRVLIS